MLLAGPFHASMRPSQSIPQAPRNWSDAPAEQLSMRNPNTRRKDKQTSPYLRLHEVAEAPAQKMNTLGQERRKRRQNSTRNATPKRQVYPFRLDVFTVFGLTTVQSAISLSSSGHKLNTEFLLSLGFPPQPCGRRASCVPKVPEEPTSLWLAHLRPPCHTPQPTLERARPPLQAKPAPSALLA